MSFRYRQSKELASRQVLDMHRWSARLSITSFSVALLLFSRFDVYDLALVLYLELLVIGLHALLRLITAMLFSNPLSSERVHVSVPARILTTMFAAGFFYQQIRPADARTRGHYRDAAE